jgi:2,4-dienoyl-CoA reductase (NADPH2)
MGIKVAEDRIEEVKPCIVCSRCLDNIFIGKPCKCSVNPNVYFSQYGLPAEHPTDDPFKKILIVGAGAAGLEAARNLKLRGYKNVTVVDQKKKAGGLLNLAQVLNDEIVPLTAWYQNEIKRLGLDVRMNTKVDAAFIQSFGADEVIIATGPETSSPDAPGKDRKNVIDSHALKELVEGHNTPGMGFMWGLSCLGMGMLGAPLPLMQWGLGTHILVKKNVVVVGGGFAGIEVASSMHEGRNMVVVEERKKAGDQIGIIDKNPELRALKKAGVKVLTSTKVRAYTDEGVLVEQIEDVKGSEHAKGDKWTIPADTIICGTEMVDNTSLYDECIAKGMDAAHVHIIGGGAPHKEDKVGPVADADPYGTPEYKRVLESVRDGYILGMTL